MGSSTRRDERGVAFPSPLVILSVLAVAMAGIAFVATGGVDRPGEMTVVSVPPAEPTPTQEPARLPRRDRHPQLQPQVVRSEVFVEVYNNSGITGLAGRTAAAASTAGWQVVGSDNWYGTIPASTVYYPERLAAAARLLGRDLGIERLKPAIDPMRLDRLTVILTTDYQG